LLEIWYSSDNPEKTQRGPGGRVEHWNRRQNIEAMRAPESNVWKASPDEPTWTHQEPVEVIAEERTLAEAMVKGESTRVTRAIRGKMKWQGDGTGDSPVYIKFSHSA